MTLTPPATCHVQRSFPAILLLLLCAGLKQVQAQELAAVATAQSPVASTSSEQADSRPMPTVKVVAQRPAEQIDRSVYDIKADVVTPNASVADVLANVPNVSVDQDGKVAIRGNQNAKIYVDGKPSAMFSGASAGDVLNSYPAATLEAVEVITTPGAEFGSDGGGGPILNLVMRRVQPSGAFGTASVNAGPQGRGGGMLSGSYVDGRMQLEGMFNLNRNVMTSHNASASDSDVGGAVWQRYGDTISYTRNTSVTLSPTLRYNLNDSDRLSAGVSLNRSIRDSGSSADHRYYRGGADPYEAYRDRSERDGSSTAYQVSLGWERKFNPSDKLNIDLRSSASISDSNSMSRKTYSVTPPTDARPQSMTSNDSATYLTELSLDYVTRISPALSIKAGGKLGRNSGRSSMDYADIDPLTGEEVIDVSRLGGWQSRERSYAAYVSPNVRLAEHWTILPGLRYERVSRHFDYRLQDQSAEDSSTKLLPSMHLQYGWGTQGAALTAAYSRRITRPSAVDLNPNLQYLNDQLYTQGDPHLAATHNDKYELKYNDKWSWVNSNLSLFREQDSPLLGRIYLPIADSTANINQAVNFGAKTNDGISWNLQARPSSSWRLDSTLSFRRVAQSYLARQAGSAGSLEAQRHANSNNLQLGMNYTGLPGHELQLTGTYAGKELIGLSERNPTWQAHLNWSWKIASAWRLRSGIRDLFDSNRTTTREPTGAVRRYSSSEQQGRILTVALSYMFGGVAGDASLRSKAGVVQGAAR